MTQMSASASEVTNERQRNHKWLYIISSIVVVALAIWGLTTYDQKKETQEAQQKADELISSLNYMGLSAPTSRDNVVRLLGDDGGVICENPEGTLKQALGQGALSNGASGPGNRPNIADSQIAQGQTVAMGIYCPQKITEFQEYVDTLKLENVIK